MMRLHVEQFGDEYRGTIEFPPAGTVHLHETRFDELIERICAAWRLHRVGMGPADEPVASAEPVAAAPVRHVPRQVRKK